MIKRHPAFRSAAALLFAIGMLPTALPAQDAADIPGATRLNVDADPGQFLANVYKDEEAGFRIAPPMGSRIIQRPSQNKMVVFVVDAKSWGGDLQRLPFDKPISLEDYAKARIATLEGKFKAVQVLESKLMKFQGYSAMRLSMSMEAPVDTATGGGQGAKAPATEIISLYQQQLLVAVKDKEFVMLTFYSPLKDREAATQTFDAMIGSLELMDPSKVKERVLAAKALGIKWLQGQTAEILKTKLNPQPQLYRMIVGGKDIGYLQITESEESQGGIKGVQITMQSRTFGDAIVLGKNTAFWAFSHGTAGELIPYFSSWDNTAKTVVNETVPGNPPRVATREFWVQITGTLHMEGDTKHTPEEIKQLQAEREAQIRKDPSHPPPPIAIDLPRYHLLVNVDGDDSQHLKEGNMDYDLLPDAPAFLPAILDYAWPRLVDLTKPSQMCFWVYNVNTRKLALRTLIVTGKKETIVVAGKQQDCWKCVDELDPGSTTLWVDSNGLPVKMQTSDQTVLVPTTEAEMKQKWSTQLKRLGQ